MNYTVFNCVIGTLYLVSENDKLKYLFIEGQKHFKKEIILNAIKQDDETLKRAKKWLEAYFNGEQKSAFELSIDPCGSDFQKQVWNILLEIPYGETITYGEIASKIAEKRGKNKMSAQAIGGAVSKNPISIIIPCHRVVGKNGLVGYDGGLDKKKFLLNLEYSNK